MSIKGPDVDIETSLKDYGIAWQEVGEDIRFFFGIRHKETEDGPELDRWDYALFPKDMKVKEEYGWASLDEVSDFVGMTYEDWLEMDLPQQIADMVCHYGAEEVFGTSYWEGLTYEEVLEKGNE